VSLLSVSDVARLLNVRPAKVRELIHSVALVAVDISPGHGRKTWRIDPDELRAFRERQQIVPERQVRRQRKLRDTTGVIEFMK
jgi:hypothetical protein